MAPRCRSGRRGSDDVNINAQVRARIDAIDETAWHAIGYPADGGAATGCVAVPGASPGTSWLVQALVGLPGGRSLSWVLCNRAPPTVSIDRDRCPSLAVLTAEMDEQGVRVVFDANAVPRIGLFVQSADDRRARSRVRNEGGPPTPAGTRARQPLVASGSAVHPLRWHAIDNPEPCRRRLTACLLWLGTR